MHGRCLPVPEQARTLGAARRTIERARLSCLSLPLGSRSQAVVLRGCRRVRRSASNSLRGLETVAAEWETRMRSAERLGAWETRVRPAARHASRVQTRARSCFRHAGNSGHSVFLPWCAQPCLLLTHILAIPSSSPNPHESRLPNRSWQESLQAPEKLSSCTPSRTARDPESGTQVLEGLMKSAIRCTTDQDSRPEEQGKTPPLFQAMNLQKSTAAHASQSVGVAEWYKRRRREFEAPGTSVNKP